MACQQLSQGSGSLPEFGGKPQLGVNGTVNELMLAAVCGGGERGALPGTRAPARHGCALPESPGSGSHVLGQVGLSPCVLALPVLRIVEKFGDVALQGGEDPKARSRCGSVTVRLRGSAVLGGVGNASTESLSQSEGKQGESGIAAGLFLGWAAGAAPSARCPQRCRRLPGVSLCSPPGVVPLPKYGEASMGR